MTPAAPAGSPEAGGTAGFALLIVLWSMVLVALIATQVTAAGRAELRLAANLRDAAVQEAAADGAVHEAIFRMLDASPAGWRADSSVRSLALAQGTATILLLDQAGLVNPNTASQGLLAALLRRLGAEARPAESLAAAIVEWRFPASNRSSEDKARDYRNAGRDDAPPEAPFRSIDELGGVLGMTPVLLALLAPHLTLFVEGDPDPGLADPLVLQALRDVVGGELAAGARGGVRVVLVSATVGRFTRRAVVRVGAGTGGRPYQILDWATGG